MLCSNPPVLLPLPVTQLLAVLLILPCCCDAGQGDPGDDAVRAAVGRAIPFIEAEGQRWIEQKKCLSCHQVPFMVWSLNAASDRGLELDSARLTEWNAWARDWRNMANDEQKEQGEEATLTGNPDVIAQLLLGRSGRESSPNKWTEQFSTSLVGAQQSDGFWKPGGQLPFQKRPKRETEEVSTLWAIAALSTCDDADDTAHEATRKALQWIGTEAEPESTEWHVARLLVARLQDEHELADRLRTQLLDRQQSNGGWGWLTQDNADAFGTGLALYALAREGLMAAEPSVARARAFLVATQQEDGSWPVQGTKAKKADRVQPTSTYWGTCWGVIGLVETLSDDVAHPATQNRADSETVDDRRATAARDE